MLSPLLAGSASIFLTYITPRVSPPPSSAHSTQPITKLSQLRKASATSGWIDGASPQLPAASGFRLTACTMHSVAPRSVTTETWPCVLSSSASMSHTECLIKTHVELPLPKAPSQPIRCQAKSPRASLLAVPRFTSALDGTFILTANTHSCVCQQKTDATSSTPSRKCSRRINVSKFLKEEWAPCMSSASVCSKPDHPRFLSQVPHPSNMMLSAWPRCPGWEQTQIQNPLEGQRSMCFGPSCTVPTHSACHWTDLLAGKH